MSSTSDDTVEDRLIQVSERLQIPTNTLQITQVRLGQLRNKPDVDEANLDDFVAATLALSSREDGLPIADEAIANAWSETLDREMSITQQLLESASIALDIDEVPPHPDALIERLGEAVDMPAQLITVARRLLQDTYETDPSVIASGRSPAGTAGGALSLASLVNGYDPDDVQGVLGGASKTSRTAVQRRCENLRELFGEDRLQDDRYQMGEKGETADSVGDDTGAAAQGAEDEEGASTDEAAAAAVEDTDGAAETAAEQTAATDGAGRATQESAASEVDDSGTETDLTVDGVESEIDSLVEDLDVDPSTRLLARGMVGDAVGEVAVDSAAELAGATLVAGLRMDDAEDDVVDVAGLRSFEPRDITQTLDLLDGAVDVDIPRRGADEIVEELVTELSLSEIVRTESLRSLERYEPGTADADFTAAEMGAGAVVFAATVNGTQVDIEDLGAISGAESSYITDAMNSVVVSLCRSLVRGDIEYEDCSWTTDLLESELSPDLGDSRTGRAIAIAKTYTAGREGRYIDDATLDAVMGAE